MPARRQGRRAVQRGQRHHGAQRVRQAPPPDLLAPLYRGFHYIKREAADTDDPVTAHRVPVFGVKDGLVSCRLIRNQINAAAAKTGKPLDPLEAEALDLFDSLAQDPRSISTWTCRVGDMQLCNNLTMLHSRTDYEDWPEASRKRHMIRLWLVFQERRPLAANFPQHNGYGQKLIAELALSRPRMAEAAPAPGMADRLEQARAVMAAVVDPVVDPHAARREAAGGGLAGDLPRPQSRSATWAAPSPARSAAPG